MLHRYRLSLAGLKGDLKRSDISSFATLQSQGQNGDYARVKKGVYREVPVGGANRNGIDHLPMVSCLWQMILRIILYMPLPCRACNEPVGSTPVGGANRN